MHFSHPYGKRTFILFEGFSPYGSAPPRGAGTRAPPQPDGFRAVLIVKINLDKIPCLVKLFNGTRGEPTHAF